MRNTNIDSCFTDYEGVSMTQRDANQKAAAKEATSIFQNHYPEFLVRVLSSPSYLRLRTS